MDGSGGQRADGWRLTSLGWIHVEAIDGRAVIGCDRGWERDTRAATLRAQVCRGESAAVATPVVDDAPTLRGVR